MKTAEQIKTEVIASIKHDPQINGEDILASVSGNCITLSGTVNSYRKKMLAEKNAASASPDMILNNEILVSNNCLTGKCDAEILKSVITAIKWNSTIDVNLIRVKVKNGWVTLEGEVEFEYQKSRAKNLTEDTTGVTGITNSIIVIPPSVSYRQSASHLFPNNLYPISGRIAAHR